MFQPPVPQASVELKLEGLELRRSAVTEKIRLNFPPHSQVSSFSASISEVVSFSIIRPQASHSYS